MKKILLQVLTPRFVLLLAAAIVVSFWYPKVGLCLAGLSPFVGGLGALTFDTMNVFLSWAGGAWSTQASASPLNLTNAQVVAAGETYLNVTGAQGAGFNVNTPTAFSLINYLTQILGFTPKVGFTWQFSLINNGTGQTATLVGGTGVTISGTATVANNTVREWLCTITNNSLNSNAAITMQNVDSGNV